MLLLALLLGADSFVLAQGGRVGPGKAVTLRTASDGVRLSGGYPIGDFSLEVQVNYATPGTILSTTGQRGAGVGAWALGVTEAGQLRFSVWTGQDWQELVSHATIAPRTPTVVRLLRSGWTSRFVLRGPDAATASITTQLSGESAYVGCYAGPDLPSGGSAPSPGMIGTVTVRYFGVLRTALAEAELLRAPTGIAEAPARPQAAPDGTPPALPAPARRGAPPDEASRSTAVGPAPGRTLASETLMPSSQDQTVAYGDRVRVTVPGGLVSSRQTVRIAEAPSVPPPPVSVLKAGETFDIAVGSQREFSKDLTIEMAYDPSRMNRRLRPSDALVVMSFDPEAQLWMSERATVDTARKVVVVRTNHLSAKRLHYIDDIGWSVTSDHFRVIFDLSMQGFLRRPAQQVTQRGQSRTVQALTLPVRLDSIANLLSDALEHAWAQYAKTKYGFRLPIDPDGSERIWVYLDPAEQSPYKANWTNDLYFPVGFVDTDYATSQDQLEHEAAHELFHVFQNQYWRWIGMYRRKWFIEATADYAADVIAWGSRGRMSRVPIDYFALPITTVNGRHEYKTAPLMSYLARSDTGFARLWAAVAEAGTDIPPVISQHLTATRKTDFEQEFRNYLAHVLFDASGPLAPTYNNGQAYVPSLPEGLLKSLAVAARGELGVTDTIVLHDFPVVDAYAGSVWGIRVKARTGQRRLLKLERTGWAGTGLPMDAYVLKNDVRPAGGARRLGSVDVRGGPLVLPLLENDDVLYVTQVNPGNGGLGTTPVRVVDAFVVTPRAPAMVGGTTQRFAISGVTEKVLWSVLEGASGGTISTSGVYAPPNRTGTFHVVATLERDRTVTAQATVQVTENTRSGVERTTGLWIGFSGMSNVKFVKPAVGFPATTFTRTPDISSAGFGDLEWSGNNFTLKGSRRDNTQEYTIEVAGSVDATGRRLQSLTVTHFQRSFEEDPWQPGKPGTSLRVSFTVKDVALSNIVENSFEKKQIFAFLLDDATAHVSAVTVSKRDAWHSDEAYDFIGWMNGTAGLMQLHLSRPLGP